MFTYLEKLELMDSQINIDIAYNSVSHKEKRRVRDLQSKIFNNLTEKQNVKNNQSKI